MTWLSPAASVALGVAVVAAVLLAAAIKILREYERGVGRFQDVKGPGLILIIPMVQQMVRVDLRTRVFDVPAQDVISRDNVSVKVNAVISRRPRCARCSASTTSTRCSPSARS